MSALEFFAAARKYKRELTREPLAGLTQNDVDLLNSVTVARWIPKAPPARKPSQAAFDIIKEFEGFHKLLPDGRVQAYPDPASGGAPWTIGYGSTGPDVKKGTIWTRAQADARFCQDVERFAEGVSKAIGAATTLQREFDAMVSLAYNVGLGAFGKSTLLRKHKEGDKAGAAAEFVRWNRAAGKVMAGLTRRRTAEAKLYRGEK